MLAPFKCEMKYIKIDQYGLFLFKYRFANEAMMERIRRQPEPAKLYHHYKLLGLNIFVRRER